MINTDRTRFIDRSVTGVRVISCLDTCYLYDLVIVGASRDLANIIVIDVSKQSHIITAWVRSFPTIDEYTRKTGLTPHNMVVCTVSERLHRRMETGEAEFNCGPPKIPFDGKYLDIVRPILYRQERDYEKDIFGGDRADGTVGFGPNRDTFS